MKALSVLMLIVIINYTYVSTSRYEFMQACAIKYLHNFV